MGRTVVGNLHVVDALRIVYMRVPVDDIRQQCRQTGAYDIFRRKQDSSQRHRNGHLSLVPEGMQKWDNRLCKCLIDTNFRRHRVTLALED